MEREHFIMFCLGAFSLAVGMIIQPYVNTLWQWIKSSIPRRKNTQSAAMATTTNYIEIGMLKEQVKDLQSQIDNLIEVKYNRESNRKNNIRRDVREYLAELRSDK